MTEPQILDAIKLFFRVLTPACAEDPGTLQRWLEGKVTSTHRQAPGSWIDQWEQDRHENRKPVKEDYTLEYMGCRYTTEAQDAFFRFAPNHRRGDFWPDHERVLAGEYEGVSAFDNAAGALDYGNGTPEAQYAVFWGKQLGPLLLGSGEGGYQVEVVSKVVLLPSRSQFIQWLGSEEARALGIQADI